MRHLKQEFDKLTFKEALTYGLAIVSLFLGFVLLFFGMFLPPEGQIHESVLTAFSVSLLFVGSVLGIEMKYADKARDLKASITKYVSDELSKARTEAKAGQP